MWNVSLLMVTGTFVPTYFCSRSESSMGGTFVPWNFRSLELASPGTFVPWNFRSMELASPGTFAPESENDVELSLPRWKMACNFHSTPCPKIVVATNCIHGDQGSQDVIRCRPTRPVEACRASEAILCRSPCIWNTTD